MEHLFAADPSSHFTISGDLYSQLHVTGSVFTSVMGSDAEQLAVFHFNQSTSPHLHHAIDRSDDDGRTILSSFPSVSSTHIFSFFSILGRRTIMLSYPPSTSRSTTLYPPQGTFRRYNLVRWGGFCELLASYPWKGCWFTSEVSTCVYLCRNYSSRYESFHSSFINPTNPNPPSDRVVRLKRSTFRCSPTPISYHYFLQAQSKCSSTMQRARQCFVRGKAERLL